MNNDLISRKLLLKDIDEVIEQYSYEKDGVAIMDASTCVRDMVNDMPTAYDVDKVIEQLENEACRCASFFCDDYRDDYERGKFDAYNEVVEIVKKGGAR